MIYGIADFTGRCDVRGAFERMKVSVESVYPRKWVACVGEPASPKAAASGGRINPLTQGTQPTWPRSQTNRPRFAVGHLDDPVFPTECFSMHDPASSGRPVLAVIYAGLLNHDAIARELKLSPGGISGPALVAHAYQAWGDAAWERLLGDWLYAAWDDEARTFAVRLCQIGSVALLYAFHEGALVFAPHPEPILASGLIPRMLNADAAARYMLVYDGFGKRHFQKHIRNLFAGNLLRCDGGGPAEQTWWRPDNRPVREGLTMQQAVEEYTALCEDRARQIAQPGSRLALSFSRGLDSAAAISFLAAEAERTGAGINTYTMRPACLDQIERDDVMDEGPLAKLHASQYPAVRWQEVWSDDLTFHDGICAVLDALGCPVHAAVNLPWILAIQRAAIQDSTSEFLTARNGNSVFSHSGHTAWMDAWKRGYKRRALALLIQASRASRLPLVRAMVNLAKLALPLPVVREYDKLIKKEYLLTNHYLRPGLLQSLRIFERMRDDLDSLFYSSYFSSRKTREKVWFFGKDPTSMVSMVFSLREGIPRGDFFSYAPFYEASVTQPEWLFSNGKEHRVFAKELLKGRVPDEIRLQRRKGRQGATVLLQLQKEQKQLRAGFEEFRQDPAVNEILDTDWMARDLGAFLRDSDVQSRRMTVAHWLRSYMLGTYISRQSGAVV